MIQVIIKKEWNGESEIYAINLTKRDMIISLKIEKIWFCFYFFFWLIHLAFELDSVAVNLWKKDE